MTHQSNPASPPLADLGAGTPPAQEAGPLDLLYDLALPVTVEFGRTHMTIQEILQLGHGSVIQLDRLAGEPVDIYVSDRKLAEGEVVVVGDQFGVRITRLVAPAPGLRNQT